MYMTTVGVAELRQNLSKYLRLVEKGERLVVTDRNRPVAELGPLAAEPSGLDRLIAQGRITPSRGRGLPRPLPAVGDPRAMSHALAPNRARANSRRRSRSTKQVYPR